MPPLFRIIGWALQFDPTYGTFLVQLILVLALRLHCHGDRWYWLRLLILMLRVRSIHIKAGYWARVKIFSFSNGTWSRIQGLLICELLVKSENSTIVVAWCLGSGLEISSIILIWRTLTPHLQLLADYTTSRVLLSSMTFGHRIDWLSRNVLRVALLKWCEPLVGQSVWF